jgi:hypothetical protein
MKAHYNKVKHLIPGIALITIIVIGISLYFQGKMDMEGFKELLENSAPVFVLTILYFYFEYLGWRHSIWKKVHLNTIIKFPPDLRGRWEGTLFRNKDQTAYEYAIEIEQSMTEILVKTYSPDRYISTSILDEIATDYQHESNFQLCYLWEGTGQKLHDQTGHNGRFYGYTILRLIEAKRVKKLEGEYFTGRETSGKLELKWKQYDLKREF